MESFQKIISQEIREIHQEIKEIRHEVTKYKGFVGGVVWAVTALAVSLQFIYNYIKGHGL